MRETAGTAAAVVILGAFPLVGDSYAIAVVLQALVFLILAYSWNIISGYTGYTSFGHTSFFGIGAYACTLAILHAKLAWPLAALLGGAAALAAAVPLGAVMLRLRGPFFAIGMFGLSRVFEAVAFGWDALTRGGSGLYLPPGYDTTQLYYALGVVALAVFAFTRWLDRSRFGLQLLAIRESEDTAEAMGVRTARLKRLAFLASAVAPGVAGGLYAVYLSFLEPSTAFAPSIELTTVAMVLFGGMGTVLGPLIGVAAVAALTEVLWARYPAVYMIILGLVIMATVFVMPRGVVPLAVRRGWLAPGHAGLRRLAESSDPSSPHLGVPGVETPSHR